MSVITAPFQSEQLALDLRLDAGPSAPSRARSAIRQLAGLCSPGMIDQLTLVASELVTNAVQHGRASGAAVAVSVGPERVVIEVASSGPPFDRSAIRDSPGVNGGFGLRVVDALADRWWVEHDGQTRVVCEFATARTSSNGA
jgi:anti-sigma regulatory factor (Ser/Thr protein kinase)